MKNIKRKLTLAAVAAAFLAAGAVGVSIDGAYAAVEEGGSGPYWFDSISKCVDPCPSLDWPNCNCFKLDPIIVQPE